MRKLGEYQCNGRSAKVYWDREWEEYVVKFFAHGVHMDAADYFTGELDDAHLTAKAAIEDERQWAT
jgi:hypothetical protein